MKVSLKEIQTLFDDLIGETQSREQIATWASQRLYENDLDNLEYDPPHEEGKIWGGIEYLMGVDLLNIDGSYLHSIEDFIDFRNKIISSQNLDKGDLMEEEFSMVQELTNSYSVQDANEQEIEIRIIAPKRFEALWMIRLSDLRATEKDIKEYCDGREKSIVSEEEPKELEFLDDSLQATDVRTVTNSNSSVKHPIFATFAIIYLIFHGIKIFFTHFKT